MRYSKAAGSRFGGGGGSSGVPVTRRTVAEGIAYLTGRVDGTLCRVIGKNGLTCCLLVVTGGFVVAIGRINLAAYDDAWPTFGLTEVAVANGAVYTPTGITDGLTLDTKATANALIRVRVDIPVMHGSLGTTTNWCATVNSSTPTPPADGGMQLLMGVANASRLNIAGLGNRTAPDHNDWSRVAGSVSPITGTPTLTASAGRSLPAPPLTYFLDGGMVETHDAAGYVYGGASSETLNAPSSALSATLTAVPVTRLDEYVYPVVQVANGASGGRLLAVFTEMLAR